MSGPHCTARPPCISRGRGIHLCDTASEPRLDGSGGAAVSCLGHGDAAVAAAVNAQLDRVAITHGGVFASASVEGVADNLVAHIPTGIERVCLVSGGSEAMKAALKPALQYCVERGVNSTDAASSPAGRSTTAWPVPADCDKPALGVPDPCRKAFP